MKKVDEFKNRLKQSILESQLSQKDIADKAGISTSLLNKYLKGVSEAGNHKLLLLANALGVNPVWLMGYDVDKYEIPDSSHPNDEKRELMQRINNYCSKASNEELKTILKIIKSIVE